MIKSTPKTEAILFIAFSANSFFNSNCPDIVVLAAAKVGGIYANNIYQDLIILHLCVRIF